MNERIDTEKSQEDIITSYLQELNRTIRSGDNNSWRALETLKTIALGGNPKALGLLSGIDRDIESRRVSMPDLSAQIGRKSKLDDVCFIVAHPVLSIKAARRQLLASIEHQAPPHTSTWETFPKLTVKEAVLAMIEAGEVSISGVPKDAWSSSDQKRMAQGKLPKGYPEHPNI
jgi:hypothetical protein